MHTLKTQRGYCIAYKLKLTMPDEAPVIHTTLLANASFGGDERKAVSKLLSCLRASSSLPKDTLPNKLVAAPIVANVLVAPFIKVATEVGGRGSIENASEV